MLLVIGWMLDKSLVKNYQRNKLSEIGAAAASAESELERNIRQLSF